jgi:hypothetical protein
VPGSSVVRTGVSLVAAHVIDAIDSSSRTDKLNGRSG